MRLAEFIEKFISCNTLIRLWKPIEHGAKEMLTDGAIMEWQAKEIELLKEIPVIHITDIMCERDWEAVNIVLDTNLTRAEVINAVELYKAKERAEMDGVMGV
jgi:hypothetical protein